MPICILSVKLAEESWRHMMTHVSIIGGMSLLFKLGCMLILMMWCVGKTTIVRNLASLCGVPLTEFALTAGSDTSDLLGGFEQVDYNRILQDSAAAVENLVQTAIRRLLLSVRKSYAPGSSSGSSNLSKICQAWKTCKNCLAEIPAREAFTLHLVRSTLFVLSL